MYIDGLYLKYSQQIADSYSEIYLPIGINLTHSVFSMVILFGANIIMDQQSLLCPVLDAFESRLEKKC